MDARELLTDLANRPLQELDHFWDSVTAEMLNSHPAGHPNSIAWLVWHTGREIDVQVAHASSREADLGPGLVRAVRPGCVGR